MRKFSVLVIALVLGIVGIAARDDAVTRFPANEIGKKLLIIGDLGVPLGEEVTISGEKRKNGPLDEWFWVEQLNGKRLAFRLGIQVNGISEWPDGTKASLVGFERGVVEYLHDYQTNIAPEAPYTAHQTAFLGFVPSKIVSPKGLELKKGD